MTFVDFAYFRMLFFRLTDSDATKDNRMLLVREIPMFSIEHLNGCIKTFSLNELLGRTFREGVSVFGRNSPVRVIHSTNKQLFSRSFSLSRNLMTRFTIFYWITYVSTTNSSRTEASSQRRRNEYPRMALIYATFQEGYCVQNGNEILEFWAATISDRSPSPMSVNDIPYKRIVKNSSEVFYGLLERYERPASTPPNMQHILF